MLQIFPADDAMLPSQGLQDQSDTMLRERICGECKLHGSTYSGRFAKLDSGQAMALL